MVLGLLAHVTPSIFWSRILRNEALVYNSYFFRTAVLRKLFDIRFSYKDCNFSRVCLLVKTQRRKPWQGLCCSIMGSGYLKSAVNLQKCCNKCCSTHWGNNLTAVTTNTRPQRVFSSVQTCVLVDVNQPLPWFFTRWPVGLEKILSPFLEHSEYMSAFKPFLQYFVVGSDTASCQDYEEKEFVECFSEETQIIDIFTHCKWQATRLSSC